MKRFFLNLIVALAIMCVIIGGAVTIVLNFTPLYAADIDQFNLVETSGLSKEQLMENYRALISYNNILGSSCLNFPDFPMSESGRIHFYEVRVIFTGLQWATIIGALVLAVTAIYSLRYDGGPRARGDSPGPAGADPGTSGSEPMSAGSNTVSGESGDQTGSTGASVAANAAAGRPTAASDFVPGLATGAAITLALPLLLALACAISWEATFVTFHKLFFNNDYWIFDSSTDPIITVLPDGFFLHCAIAIFVLVAATSSFILAGCYAILKKR